MTLDKNTLEKLLNLPDESLILIIKRLAKEKGLNIEDLNIKKEQLDLLRKGLMNASDSDITHIMELFKDKNKK